MTPAEQDAAARPVAAYAKQLIHQAPPGLTAGVAIGGALSYAAALAFDDAQLCHATAASLRRLADELTHRAARLAAH